MQQPNESKRESEREPATMGGNERHPAAQLNLKRDSERQPATIGESKGYADSA